MVRVYFSLGSNEGDRLANINRALEELKTALNAPEPLISSIIETKAWGFDGPDFLNCAAAFDWDPDRDSDATDALSGSSAPERLLDICKAIELKLGRTGGPKRDKAGRRIYSSRPIDIDILFYGLEKIDTPRLTIPHPLISKRDFVKIPLNEIADGEIRSAYPEIFETI